MVTHDLKEGFTLGSRVLVFDKVRVDPQAPGAYGARITYNIPLDHSRDSASSIHMAQAAVEGASRVDSGLSLTGIHNMDLLLEETVPGGGHASLIVKRGQSLRITDLRGGANVSVMLFNASEKSERLNLPDTLKCQHTAKLTAGHCLYSDMGRVLAAIVADTCGWHDSIGGVSNAEEVQRTTARAAIRNCAMRSIAMAPTICSSNWANGGSASQDLLMTLNLFSRVDVTDDGRAEFRAGQFEGGRLRRTVCADEHARRAHRDPASARSESGIRAQAGQACVQHRRTARRRRTLPTSCEENVRGFINTDRFFL